MIQETAKILWNTIECSGYFRMGLAVSAEGYAAAGPGQFVMVKFPDQTAPLLRRPFSIHRLIREDGRVTGIEILYKVVGKVTQLLTMSRKGERLNVIGPLGNRFKIPPLDSRIFIAAGGIGVAPMYFLTTELFKHGRDSKDCTLFIGGRSKDDLLCMNDFMAVGLETFYLATDDGSAGEKELVTVPLERAVSLKQPDIMYACGPLPMLKAIAEIARKYEIPCQVSIETMMACGIGACLGCAVHSKKNPGIYLHACTEGPVFDAGGIQF